MAQVTHFSTAENAECAEDKSMSVRRRIDGFITDCIIKTYNFIFLSPRSSRSSRLKIDRMIQPYLKKQSQFAIRQDWHKLFYDK